MIFHTLALTLVISSNICHAVGRSPAVEDFVGIEVEEPETIPKGTEALFNFEQDIKKVESQITKNKSTNSQVKKTPFSEEKSWVKTAYVAFSLLIGLPIFVWFMVMGHLKKKASLESALNIEVLENYRNARQKKEEEKTRKAS